MESKNMAIIGVIVIILVIAGVYASGIFSNTNSADGKTIKVLAGAGTIKAMNELKANFEKENPGVEVEIRYGGAADLFGILETQKDADIFIPGDTKYTQEGQKKGYLINDTIKDVTKHIPTIAVQAGNPKNIQGIEDLANPGVRVVLGDPKGPAIGKTSEQILGTDNLLAQVKPNVVGYTTTVNQLLTYLVTDQADATIIWQDMLSWSEGKGKIEEIKIPADQNKIKTIPIAVTVYTKDKDLSMKFEDYVLSDEGLAIWKKWGFEPVTQ